MSRLSTIYHAEVVGMHFREKEGVPAKEIVSNWMPPVEVKLEREPDNQFDTNAIKVIYKDQHVGFINKDVACYIAPDMDEGHPVEAVVSSFRDAGHTNYPQITVTTYQD